MMSFFTGIDARTYAFRFGVITSYFLETNQIKPRDPDKPKSASFRHMIDKIFAVIPEEFIEEYKKREEAKT